VIAVSTRLRRVETAITYVHIVFLLVNYGQCDFYVTIQDTIMITTSILKDKILAGERIDREEALELFNWDLLELGHAADERRKMIHPDETVGFIVDRIINFTNRCEAECAFCAYHARAGRIEPYDMCIDDILYKVQELADAGGTQVMLQGGLHPDFTTDTYCDMVRTVKNRFPEIYLHSFSPAEIVHMAGKSGESIDHTITRLQEAGLDSVPGASDMLVDRVRRRVSPRKISRDQWCSVIRSLSSHGMASSATMTYGMGETLEERIEHLDVIRSMQDETGIIRAFIPWSFSPANTEMQDIIPATGFDYLKIVAIARIYIDNVRYIQAGWLTEGLKLAQIALAMGANDMGGVLTEEVVVKATGVNTSVTMTELIDIIENAHKIPVLRDSRYDTIRSFA
jgi:cyclic dehypoxanthinyl futalosine synthase